MSFEAVQWSVRSHGQKQQLAMCFDPGESTSLIHTDHAMDLMWGLLHLRGWKDDTPTVKLGLADGWEDRWWTRAVGPNAFVVEAGLARSSMTTDFDDVMRVASLTRVAWCMELNSLRDGGPTPDLITGAGPDGLVIANVDPSVLYRAMDQARPAIFDRMATLSGRRLRHSASCQGTVPTALVCAFESTSLEDAVRNAVSLGGDADTIAAIAGAVGEALHGLPEGLVRIVKERYLEGAEDITTTLDALYERTAHDGMPATPEGMPDGKGLRQGVIGPCETVLEHLRAPDPGKHR